MQLRNGREHLLHDPVYRCVAKCMSNVVHHRKVVNDIAQRGGLDEENASHGMWDHVMELVGAAASLGMRVL